MRTVQSLFLLLLLSVCGCSVLDTGPRMAQSVSATAEATAFKLIEATMPEKAHATVTGGLNDPTYRVAGFVGAGWYFDMVMGLQGADLDFNLQADLVARLEQDESLRDRLFRIITQPAMDEQQKFKAIMDFIREVTNTAQTAVEEPSPAVAPGAG